MKGNIIMGFWHNTSSSFCEESCGGQSEGMELNDTPMEYNVIVVDFMQRIDGSNDSIPDFKPSGYTDSEFRQQVEELHKQGRKVLIALGGRDANIALHRGDELSLATRINELVDKFGFDGLNIALDEDAMVLADNQLVIPAALRMLKDYYCAVGRSFIISMTPRFAHLSNKHEFVSYINALEGYYDFIAPVYYGADDEGLWVDSVGWVSHRNEVLREDFLYFLTESLLTGTRNFIKIPYDKFILALPINSDAAEDCMINPQSVKSALVRLKASELSIHGLMAWPVSGDADIKSSGEPDYLAFIQCCGDLIGDSADTTVVPATPEWRPGLHYSDTDVVGWNGKEWVCVMSHDSDIFWTPARSSRLWIPC